MQHKKKPSRQAIDNFIPSGRPLGPPSSQGRRPVFPDVGTTLSAYHGSLSPAQPSLLGTKRPKKRRWHWSKKRIILLCLLPFILLALWLGIKFALNLSKVFHGNILGIFSTTKLRGEDDGRVNILLAGNSADDAGHNGANLTDSIMIMSIDTRNHRAFLLSVPRDLYVNIPGYRHAKINEAYVAGQNQHFSATGYPSGGMGLLEEVIYENLGIKSQYYALVDYTALRDAVNAVGGINFTVKSTDPRGLYDANIDYATHGPLVNLSNGVHHINGVQALDLARARGDPPAASYGYANSDYTRTQNQRQLLVDLKGKIFSSGVLANPVKLTSLFDTLGKHVRTDMTLGEAHRFYDVTKEVGDTQIKSYGLNDLNGKNYLASYRTVTGESALIPAAGLDDFITIRQVLARLLSNNPLVKEDASVVLLNGTDTYGLAGKNQTILSGRNINVIAVGDAIKNASTTYIINTAGTSKPATLKTLQALYGPSVTTTNPYASRYTADFIVVLGSDRLTTP